MLFFRNLLKNCENISGMRERSYRGRVRENYLKKSPLVGDLIEDK
jgi:hypothetical protein